MLCCKPSHDNHGSCVPGKQGAWDVTEDKTCPLVTHFQPLTMALELQDMSRDDRECVCVCALALHRAHALSLLLQVLGNINNTIHCLSNSPKQNQAFHQAMQPSNSIKQLTTRLRTNCSKTQSDRVVVVVLLVGVIVIRDVQTELGMWRSW
jgi:hypothetical protein